MCRLSLLIVFILIAFQSKAQLRKDSIDLKEKIKIIPLPVNYNPKKAIIRSAILPGWGQITNKKYWKLPLVYGAIATPVVLFYQNYNQYLDAKSAYILATDNNPDNDDQIKQPYYSVRNQPERIRAFRNQVRQNMDYCALFFIALWGLNVVDAAVDAHLKTFDISDDLSIQIKGGYSPSARTSGISIVVPLSK
ncbi:MAG: hypothetical protein FGM46_03570 [Ferruginibacter sp.]|nr:hypothetical protein [Ferruginibacter sp.]